MQVVVHDFTAIAAILPGELTLMQDACVAYEDVIDFLLLHRSRDECAYEDYMVDYFCDCKDLTIPDRQLVRQAYYRLRPLVNQLFPMTAGEWVCCGFVHHLGYFIHSVAADEHRDQLQRAVTQSIRPLWGYYDSHLSHTRV